MARKIIPQETREYLDYCPIKGSFTWIKKVYRNTIVGSEAGTVGKNGYRYITFKGQKILAHRLAWLFQYGEQPPPQIDHINRERLDNRVSNLRSASSSLNGHNRTGVKGVRRHKDSGWQAYISINRKFINLYCGPSYEKAVAARANAEYWKH
jgi:putative component of toxin-antitoxin plasmid stabilization module